jgi:hypothetical protein
MQSRSFSLLSLLGAALLAGSGLVLSCGGGDGTSNEGSITLSVSPTSASVQQGGSVQVTGTITRSGGFSGTVNFAVSGSIPTGLTGSVGTISTSGNISTATITLTTTSATPAGTYPITVTGSGSGVTSSSVTFTLTVTAAPVGSYTLTLSSPTLTINQGGNGTVTVNINRTNFPAGITMTAENLPGGVSASFSPASPVTANSTTLTLTATSSATTGPATVTIRGSTPGLSPENSANVVADQTVTLSLTVNATSAGSFTLSATPATLSFAQGGNGTSTININRTGGFAGNVALSVTGQVTNLTATLNPTSTTTNSSTLTVTTTAGVPAGDVTLTITGVSGSITQTTTVTVTITAAGSFTLSAAPPTLSFAQGGNGSSTITINRTGGFAGSVAFTVTGQVANMTAAVTPSPTTGNTGTLNVTTTAGVATGPVTLTITGTSGAITQTTTVTVTITSTGGGGNVILNWSACPATSKAIWVAGLNGTTWTAITGTNDQYSFTVNAAKGGYAYVTQNGASNSLTVFLGTQAEVIGTLNFCTGTSPTGKTVTGIASGFGSGTFPNVNVNLGGALNTANSFAPAFTLNNVPDGPVDFIAWMSDAIDPPTTANNRGLAMRGINPANGSSLGTIDMSGGTSFQAASGIATITGLVGGEAILGGMSYLTAAGGVCRAAQLYSILTGSSGMTILGFPTAQQQGGDYHQISLIATSGTAPNTTFRQHTEVFQTMGNRTFAFAPAFTGTVTSLGGANKRLQVTGTIPTLYNSAVSLVYTSANPNRSVVVSATPGWIGGSSLTLGLDEFGALTGWLTSYAPLAAATVNYSATVSGFSSLQSTTCVEGLITRVASFAGQM